MKSSVMSSDGLQPVSRFPPIRIMVVIDWNATKELLRLRGGRLGGFNDGFV